MRILPLIFFFGTSFVFAGTAPQYSVINVPAPPTKFKNFQIDGLTFLPNGKLVVCLPSGEIFFRNLKLKSGSFLLKGSITLLGFLPFPTPN